MDKKTHPSWGSIKISKIHSAPNGKKLFKSRVKHRTFFELSISSVYESEDEITKGHLCEDRKYISIYLSPTQLMEALLQVQEVYSFTPCTFNYYNGEYIEEPPQEYFNDKYGGIFRQKAQAVLNYLIDIINTTRSMLEQKTIRKKDVQTLLNLQESVYGSISGSLPYLINTFYEDMNREFENNKVLQKITKEDADGQTRAKEDV